MLGSIEVDEIAGIVVEVRATYDVSDLGGVDHATLVNSLVTAGGVPRAGDEITVNNQTLVLEERKGRFYDVNDARIELVFRRQDEIPLWFRGSTVTEQVQTELDRDGNQILLTHNGITQGGTVTKYDPHNTLEAEFVRSLSSPGVVSSSIVGFVNDAAWQGGDPGEWLCTECPFDPIDLTVDPPKWRFRAVFQRKIGGWDPTAAFTDPETGQPGVDLVEDQGIKIVPQYFDVDFEGVLSP